MEEINEEKLYKFYEIIKDFNRLRILMIIQDRKIKLEDLVFKIDLPLVTVKHQLEFLINKEIVREKKLKKGTYYSIKNLIILRIIKEDIKVINEL